MLSASDFFRHSGFVLHRSPALCQYPLHDFARDVGQAEVAALELVGQLFVVDTESVQHRRLQVVHVHRVLDDVVAVIVGLAV